ncbi:MAG: cyclodeaminase/cyclohydrolase family protein [Planctomycetota bacterium]
MVEDTGSDSWRAGSEEAERFVDSSLADFAAACADASGGPAAGSGSAAAGAIGAALVSMALRCAAGERRGADPEDAPREAPYLLGRADEVDALRTQLVDLVDEDHRVYAEWRRLEAANAPEDKRAKAREAVLETPFEILERAVFALRLAAVSADSVPDPWAAELRTGAALLQGAHMGARAVFEANLDAFEIPDADARRAELGVLAGAAHEALSALGLG